MKRVLSVSIVAVLFFSLLTVRISFAQPAEVANGLAYLTNSQNGDGSWGGISSATDQTTATATVLETLAILGETDSSAYQAGTAWLDSRELAATDQISRRILAGSSVGSDSMELIALVDYMRKAWGGAEGYDVNILDTTLALQALKRINSADSTTIGYGMNFLLAGQNSDGGWGFTETGESSPYITALATLTLQQFAKTYTLFEKINNGADYLTASQQSGGGFGLPDATIHETALAYLVLSAETTDNTVLGSGVEYLKATQAANGSWLDDPFSTALAMQTLFIAENRHATQPQPTSGSVTGKVIDAMSSQPLAGAAIFSVSDPSIITTSDQLGNFSLTAIPSGEQTLTFNLSGYQTGTIDVNIVSSQFVNIGTVLLAPLTTVGVVKGTVLDALTGLPLAGAQLDMSGVYTGTTTADASGIFQFQNLPPGEITINTSLSGYKPVSATGVIEAGKIVSYTPKLQPLTATTGSISGRIIDTISGNPLEGAVIGLLPDLSLSAITDLDGNFGFTEIAEGPRQLTLSCPGYSDTVIFIEVIGGVENNLGDIELSENNTTGIIKGLVTDTNGIQLADATVRIGGDYYATTVTDMDGAFSFSDVPAGNVTVSAEKNGFAPVSASGEIVPGSVLVFNPQLTLSIGHLTGTILDSTTRSAIAGARITSADGREALSVLDGSFMIDNLLSGTREIIISAAGYQSQVIQVIIIAGETTDIGDVYLDETGFSSTITGRVMDAVTGNPLKAAEVSIPETGFSAETDEDGRYLLSGIELLEFTVRIAATGYDSQAYGYRSAEHGTYSSDFELTVSQAGNLVISSLTTRSSTYTLNEDAVIEVDIDNQSENPVEAVIEARIFDEAGEQIGTASPEDPVISLEGLGSIQKNITWNTGQFAPGEYRIVVRLIAPGSVSHANMAGFLLAESATSVSLTPTPEMSGGIALDPPVTQVDMQRPISIKATLRNTGNIHLNTPVLLQASLNGIVVYSAESMLDELPVNNLVDLDFGSFIPQEGGTYNLSLTPTVGTIASDITAELYVGTHAATTFTVDPEVVYPGAARVRGKIHIEGVGILEGEAENPRVPIIKEAIQKGVNWEQVEVMSWQNKNQCNGCHIQSQALVGIEGARDVATVDDSVARNLFASFASWQKTNGSIDGFPDGSPNEFAQTITNLGLWGLASWHDPEEAAPNVIMAAEYMLKIQKADGRWVKDYYASVGWWFDDVSYTAIAMKGIAQAYSISSDQRYLDSLVKAAEWLAKPGRVAVGWNMVRAHQIMGLNSVRQYVSDDILSSQLTAVAKGGIQSLLAEQRIDGGWGRYSSSVSDSLVTAQVLYAILNAGVSGSEPGIVEAIDFLLNNQAANGSWYSQNGILSTRLAATSWVIISLPIAFEKVRGIDVHADIDSGDNVFLSSFEPLPISQSGQLVNWELHGVDGTGKDIEFAINLEGLEVGELRKVVENATLSFRDEISNEEINIAIDVPSVRVEPAVDVEAAIDKTAYLPHDDLLTSIQLNNYSNSFRDSELQISIEDENGYILHNFDDIDVPALDPAFLTDWHYRIPLTVNNTEGGTEAIFRTTIDFEEVFNELELEGAVLDENSIRVVEIDPIASAALQITTKTDVLSGYKIEVTGYLEKETSRIGTRSFYLYFDILKNGTKPPIEQIDMPEPGNFLAFSNDAGQVYIAEILGDGDFGKPVFVDDLAYYPKTGGIALEDFNNDGFVDIVTATGNPGVIYYLENNGDGTNSFLPKVDVGEFSEAQYFVWDFASGDFDDDGNKDFVVGMDGTVYLFRGDGHGTFFRTTMPFSEWSPRAKFATDFNGDGRLDLFITVNSGSIYYYENIGYGLFATPQLIEDIGFEPMGLVVGDYDSDGFKDIIVNSNCWNGKDICDHYILKGNEDGSFQSKEVVPSLDFNNTVLNRPMSYDAGDFNSDGKLDIIALSGWQNKAFYFAGTGEGSFLEPIEIWTSSRTAWGISGPPAFPRYQPVIGAAEQVTPSTYQLFWNTGATRAGNYKIKVELLENGQVVDTTEAPFEIVASSASSEPVLTTRVATDKIAYNSGEPVRIDTLTQNNSLNFTYQDLATLAEIVDPTGAVVYSEKGQISYLADGQFSESGLNWNTGQNQQGIYNVSHMVMVGETVLASSSASFEILSSAATGRESAVPSPFRPKSPTGAASPLTLPYRMTAIRPSTTSRSRS
jgi:prenyltransferase beta subunit